VFDSIGGTNRRTDARDDAKPTDEAATASAALVEIRSMSNKGAIDSPYEKLLKDVGEVFASCSAAEAAPVITRVFARIPALGYFVELFSNDQKARSPFSIDAG